METQSGGSLPTSSIVFKTNTESPSVPTPEETVEPIPETEPEAEPEESYVTILEGSFTKTDKYRYVANGGSELLIDNYADYLENQNYDGGEVQIYSKIKVDKYYDSGDYLVTNGGAEQCYYSAEPCVNGCAGMSNAGELGYQTVFLPAGGRAACYARLHPNGSTGFNNIKIRIKESDYHPQ
ncbi:hypothetical protein [Pseudomonas coronafaciens]|uniref:hypothetical protein n=1 Tax=Pseudomonas coronafaciens TaxID=53409 RepID=UPI0012D7C8B6|nr:hypothetical protein [Pseudomonas coronafaciens]